MNPHFDNSNFETDFQNSKCYINQNQAGHFQSWNAYDLQIRTIHKTIYRIPNLNES